MILDLDLRVRLLRPDAKLPTYATEGAAALDLFAAEGATLYPGERAVVDTGVAIALPDGWCAAVKSRSGLCRKGYTVDWGLVDSDYRGAIGVQCANVVAPGPQFFHDAGEIDPSRVWVIAPGDRIAQLVLLPVGRATLVQVDELPETARGAGGFGSSGLR